MFFDCEAATDVIACRKLGFHFRFSFMGLNGTFWVSNYHDSMVLFMKLLLLIVLRNLVSLMDLRNKNPWRFEIHDLNFRSFAVVLA